MHRPVPAHTPHYVLRLVHLVTRVPWLTIAVSLGLAGLALWHTGAALNFETSRNTLASAQTRYIQRYNELQSDFGALNYLMVVIEPPNLERGQQFVRALAPRLRADTKHFERVIDEVDTRKLEGKKLLYLSPGELRTLRQRLEDAEDLIVDLSDTPGLVSLLTSINQEMSRAMVSHLTGGLLGTSIATTSGDVEPSLDISFLAGLFTEMDIALASPETSAFHSPWDSFFLKDGEVFSSHTYLTSKNDRFLFVLVDDRPSPSGFIKHAAPLRVLRAHLKALRRDFPDVQAGVTGGDALGNDEMLAAQHDMTLATGVALIGVAILFMIAFRQAWRPLLVVSMLIVALCWTLGWTTLTVGHLNILSIAFLPILIGLGIDFGIHLLARYSEERANGADFDTAIHTACGHTGPSVAAAALTTALAFYAVMLADFRGLAELGFIAGSGLLICLLASFTVLPAMLALYERHRQPPPGVWRTQRRDSLRGLMRFPRLTIILIGSITLAGVMQVPLPRFDYNLLHLQAQGTESVIWEERLQEGSGHSSWYALSTACSLEELYRKKAQFTALPVVERVASLAAVIPEDQAVRLPLVEQLAPYVADISGDWDHPEPIDLPEMVLALRKIRFKFSKVTGDFRAITRQPHIA